MADLDDIGIELNDDQEESTDMIEICPSPPPQFRQGPIAEELIIRPPIIFNDQEQSITLKNIVPFDNIFFNDAKVHLFEAVKANTVPENQTKKRSHPGFFQRLVNFFRSAASSNNASEFRRQCEQLLELTKQNCNMSDHVHIRMLYTIYRRLTNSKDIFYSPFGTHWEDIGFQTENPETDFRSTGLFSIFFLLYFVDSMYLPLAKQIYQLSRNQHQQFPFCCIGINLSGMLIRYLRRAVTHHQTEKLIDSRHSEQIAIDLSGQLFIALYLNFYIKWKENNCSIEQTQKVLQELDQLLMHRPKLLLEQFNQYFQRKYIEDKS